MELTRRGAAFGALFTGVTLTAFSPAIQALAQGSGKIYPFPTHVRDLPNGLRVIVVETGFPDIVSIQIPVSVGSRNEVEPGKSGFAHFFEHMMFRGTKNIPANEYSAIVKRMGADTNAYTSDDRTNYHMTINKEDLEEALRIEADRFQNLDYPEADFRTEALAVLGEYNKNSANPTTKLFEAMRDTAFSRHTYKHTTMGFLEDIKQMPDQFAYSRQFFDRYYRPERTTIIVAGDVKPDPVFSLVEKYWGAWRRGAEVPAVPAEPEWTQARYVHVPWETETLPWVAVSFRGPAAYPTPSNPAAGDMQVLDVLASYAFSSSSPLYQRLVVQEQKVEALAPSFPDAVDPQLLSVLASVKDKADIPYVRDAIQAELAQMRRIPADPARIAAIRSNLKYGFAANLDNTESVADAIVPYVAATRDPDMVNKVYARYDAVTADDLIRVANRYFVDKAMVVSTLANGDIPAQARLVGGVDSKAMAITPAAAQVATAAAATVQVPARPAPAAAPRAAFKELIQRTESPLVDVALRFATGTVDDPVGKEGLAQLTAMMVTNAGSQALTFEQIQQARFPMAAGFGAGVDKEVTTFQGQVHLDNLDRWYDIAAGQLLTPGFREADFTRVKSNLLNAIRVSLRGNNDEELGNEVLYEQLYAGHPYRHLNLGRAKSVEALTLDDVRRFHREWYTQALLTLGIAGAAPPAFVSRVRADLAAGLPAGAQVRRNIPAPKPPQGIDVTLVQKDTMAAAISMGFPIDVRRGHPDFLPLYLARSYLGEHRNSAAHLFNRIREIRGMNYGDYAYTEYFPAGMFLTAPQPGVPRSQQAFRVWIRPVPPEQTHFAIRIAKYELDKLVREGISQADFEATRSFLTKQAGLLTARQGDRLGYTLDQQFYGLSDFPAYVRTGLSRLTRDQVNAAIKRHLGGPNLAIVVVTPQAQALKAALIADAPSPITYAAEKPAEILAEDKVIERYPLKLTDADVKVVSVAEVFEGPVFQA